LQPSTRAAISTANRRYPDRFDHEKLCTAGRRGFRDAASRAPASRHAGLDIFSRSRFS